MRLISKLISEPDPHVRRALAYNETSGMYWVCEMFGYCPRCDAIIPFNMEADLLHDNNSPPKEKYEFWSCDEHGDRVASYMYKSPRIFYIPNSVIGGLTDSVELGRDCSWSVIKIITPTGREIFDELNSTFNLTNDPNDIGTYLGRPTRR